MTDPAAAAPTVAQRCADRALPPASATSDAGIAADDGTVHCMRQTDCMCAEAAATASDTLQGIRVSRQCAADGKAKQVLHALNEDIPHIRNRSHLAQAQVLPSPTATQQPTACTQRLPASWMPRLLVLQNSRCAALPYSCAHAVECTPAAPSKQAVTA